MTQKELFDQRKAEQRALYESMKQFKRDAKDGKRGQRLGAMIKFTDKKGVEKDILYIPYSQYTKVTTKKLK
jgi:hypothetical protein